MARVPISFATGGADSSELTATKARVLAPYTAITSDSDDEPAAGTMADKSGSVSTAAVSQNGNNIRMKVPANGFYNTNAYLQAAASEFGNAAQNQVLSGAKFTSSAGLKKDGSIPSKAAATYNTSASNQTIPAGQYLGGAQTIRGVTTSNIAAGNIKKGVKVQVGDAASSGRIANVEGSYTQVSQGQAAVVAGAMREGYSGFANGGNEVKGSIPDLAAKTYNTSTGNQTIPAGSYIAGAQTIRGVTTSNIAAGNIKKGVNIQVGDSASPGRITNVTGSYSTVSSGQAAVAAAALRKGYSGFANGGNEIKGAMENLGGGTYYATTQDQEILTVGRYVNQKHLIKALTQANLSSGNILRGKTISISNGQTNIFSATGSSDILKVVRGQVTYGNTAITLTFNGGSYTCYYADVNPGITPVYVLTISDNLYVFHDVQANTGNLCSNSPARQTAIDREYNINGVLPAAKTSVRLPGRGTNNKYIWYLIFGY